MSAEPKYTMTVMPRGGVRITRKESGEERCISWVDWNNPFLWDFRQKLQAQGGMLEADFLWFKAIPCGAVL